MGWKPVLRANRGKTRDQAYAVAEKKEREEREVMDRVKFVGKRPRASDKVWKCYSEQFETRCPPVQ